MSLHKLHIAEENGDRTALFVEDGQAFFAWATLKPVEEGAYPCGMLNIRTKEITEMTHAAATAKIDAAIAAPQLQGNP